MGNNQLIIHKPVLVREVLKYWVNPVLVSDKRKLVVVVDATCGEGGHSLALLKKAQKEGWLKKLQLVCLDWDPKIIERAKANLKKFARNVIFKEGNYRDLKSILNSLDIYQIDGILFDLGASTFHFKKAERGFSFSEPSFLDMRYTPNNKLTAEKVINEFPPEKLIEIIKRYGEETRAPTIVKAIVRARAQKRIKTAKELAQIIAEAIPKRFWPRKIHPATKTFQALRIFINQELNNLEQGLRQALAVLAPKARIVVLSFHSLEDRIVKRIFRLHSQPKTDMIYGVTIEPAYLKILTKKPIVPSLVEREQNPASRSAKMRVAERRR